MATTYTKGRVYKLEIPLLQPDPGQARTFMDAGSLSDLTASIRKHGVLEPILFRQDEQGNPVIVAGERRVAAAKAAGLTTIPAIFIDGNHREISLVENLLREGLTPVEEAEAMDRLLKENGYSQYQLSDLIGKSQPAISQTVTIVKLPEDIRNQCRSNPNIPKTVLLEIAAVKTERAMWTKFKKYMEKQKAPGPKTRAARLSPAARFLTEANRFHEELVNLAWQNWTEEEKEDLANRMRDLRQGAVDVLSALGVAVDEREREDEGAGTLS